MMVARVAHFFCPFGGGGGGGGGSARPGRVNPAVVSLTFARALEMLETICWFGLHEKNNT